MRSRYRAAGLIAALLLAAPGVPARVQAMPAHAAGEADIWVRLFTAPHNLVKAAIYVHTAYQAQCTARISGANGKGKEITPQPGSITAGDDGIALFRYFFAGNAPRCKRIASATCHGGNPAQQITVQSSFYLPYDAKANAVPPSAPLKVVVPPVTVKVGNLATIAVRTLPRALCTGLVQGETADGIQQSPLAPLRVSASGNASWTVKPSFTGIGTIAVTCDLHKTFARGEGTFTVQ